MAIDTSESFPTNDKRSGPSAILDAHQVHLKINTLGKCDFERI